MNRNEKSRKRSEIGAKMDLGNSRFKDEEVERLYDFLKNADTYNGKKRTFKSRSDGICSDGKYTRFTETTYTVLNSEDKLAIDYFDSYHDDDGQAGSTHKLITSARRILELIWMFTQNCSGREKLTTKCRE